MAMEKLGLMMEDIIKGNSFMETYMEKMRILNTTMVIHLKENSEIILSITVLIQLLKMDLTL